MVYSGLPASTAFPAAQQLRNGRLRRKRAPAAPIGYCSPLTWFRSRIPRYHTLRFYEHPWYSYLVYRQVPNLSFVAIIWINFSRSPNVHLITAYLFFFPCPDREPGIPYRYTGTNTRYRCTGSPVPYRTGTTYRTGIVRTVYRRVVYK